MRKVRLVAFDLDGVLVTIKSSWWYLHEYLGSSRIVKKSRGTKLYLEGKISYQEWIDIDVQAMISAKPGVTYKEIMKAFERVEIEPSAKLVTSILKKAGYKLAIVSGGIKQLAESIANKLGIDIVKANPLQFTNDGRLIGGLAVVEPLAKDKVLRDIANDMHISLSEIAYIGDSEWDIPALEIVGMPIALGCSECIEHLDRAILINCLWEVIPLLLR